MTEAKLLRLNKVAKELNVGIETIVEFLKKKKFDIEKDPNAKITSEMYQELLKEFSSDSNLKKKSESININNADKRVVTLDDVNASKNKEQTKEEEEEIFDIKPIIQGPKITGKIELENLKPKKKEEPTPEPQPELKKEEKKEVKIEPKDEPQTQENTTITPKNEPELISTEIPKIEGPKVLTKIELEDKSKKKSKKTNKELNTVEPTSNTSQEEEEKKPEEILEQTPINQNTEITEEPKIEENEEIYRTEVKKLDGPKIQGTIDLSQFDRKPTTKPTDKTKDNKTAKPVFSTANEKEKEKEDKKRKRKRINISKIAPNEPLTAIPSKKENERNPKKEFKKDKKKKHRYEIDEEEVERSVKFTISSMQNKSKSQSSKYRREKRDAINQRLQEELEQQEKEKNILKITEFVSVNELASLMDVPVNEVISTCMSLGLFVSINQRLDADTITIIADEFGFKTEFITVDVQTDYQDDQEDKEEDLVTRPPIVTVMGHVDHGKTKLLDYIRNTNVVAGEAGGITQHIGAYSVTLENGRQITFLDTPGHEAFTAMRARGAQVTDIAIIVIAADDGIKPQTKEAINHAQAAGVPMIFAINKIDKPEANPDRIREQLANMNLLVEEWGGKYQSQEISAKQGLNVNLLLEKVLLEADLLDLKANPKRRASGVIIESSLDKGKGYVANMLVKTGTLHIGDIVLAGTYYGRVKAMFNERNQKLNEAGPSMPVQILGLNGAPQAGDKFNVLTSEQEARDIANKRAQIIREQGLRTQKHITLEEIGRRLQVGNFKELNIIIKGDVDGSIEALSDSLIKLSNDEIQVNVIHKGVGQISESDVMLATASEAIIIGFQVRPSANARKLAEQEQIEIRLYSIIYDAIEEIKLAIEGMLSPVIKEEILGSAEVKETFKIGKVGTVAGCLVHEGKIVRSSKVRVIRDGIVAYTGELSSLKRFKDDAREVTAGLECGLSIDKFNDIKVGDIIECFNEVEVKKKL
ncbi:MAG: translation initiation factor IF-2 [Bacteroidales bacterium]|nr:translation initiation factor IF-2 [Bacteroidales bacterium]